MFAFSSFISIVLLWQDFRDLIKITLCFAVWFLLCWLFLVKKLFQAMLNFFIYVLWKLFINIKWYKLFDYIKVSKNRFDLSDIKRIKKLKKKKVKKNQDILYKRYIYVTNINTRINLIYDNNSMIIKHSNIS